ncbi:MAG TPA: hypothetical protein VH186_13205 [Chloroflexia bacterium]|nr:hypothetical protein [Chloroflexia bacterium]
MGYRRGVSVTRLLTLILFILVVIGIIIAFIVIGGSTGTTVIK